MPRTSSLPTRKQIEFNWNPGAQQSVLGRCQRTMAHPPSAYALTPRCNPSVEGRHPPFLPHPKVYEVKSKHLIPPRNSKRSLSRILDPIDRTGIRALEPEVRPVQQLPVHILVSCLMKRWCWVARSPQTASGLLVARASLDTKIPRGEAPAICETRHEQERFGWRGNGCRRKCFPTPRRERGAGRCEARNERRTGFLRKKIQQSRPIQLNRPGSGFPWASLPPRIASCDNTGRLHEPS